MKSLLHSRRVTCVYVSMNLKSFFSTMDTRFFTNPPFVRPTTALLQSEDTYASILKRDDRTCFLLCHENENIVISYSTEDKQHRDEIDSANSLAPAPQTSKRLDDTDAAAEHHSLQGPIMSTQNRVADLSSLRLNGTDLERILSIAFSPNIGDDTPALPESQRPLFILLGHDPSNDTSYYVCDLSNVPRDKLISALPLNSSIVNLRSIAHRLSSDSDATTLSIAQAMCRYHRQSSYCTRCGSVTRCFNHGVSRKCDKCGTVEFPRQDPAMLALIHCGRYCLLGRKSQWPKGRYSCLAGFTEIGESMEETVSGKRQP